MSQIRRSRDRLVVNKGIPIPWRGGLYFETGPWVSSKCRNSSCKDKTISWAIILHEANATICKATLSIWEPCDHADFPSEWWRHQMETFSALLALCAGNSPTTANFPHKGSWRGALVYVFFDVHLNKPLGKQSWGWWFESPSCSSWRYCNAHLQPNCWNHAYLIYSSLELSCGYL